MHQVLKLPGCIKWKIAMKLLQANPIIVDGIIYTPMAGGYIIAIDGKIWRKLIWKSEKFENSVAERGLLYHKDNDNKIARIIFFLIEKTNFFRCQQW